jgi:hypothetical protein
VAATVAAAVVAHTTKNHAGQPLLDDTTLNAVLVLMVVTAILGPVLTELFAPKMRGEAVLSDAASSSSIPAGTH